LTDILLHGKMIDNKSNDGVK